MLRSDRLILRPWQESDLPALAELTADPVVMEHFPKTLDRAESDAFAARLQAHVDAHGFGMWAAEAPGVAPFVGIIGLALVDELYPFGPAIEVGWRLSRGFWGRGYAVEGARACLAQAFGPLDRTEVVAMTIPANWRSQRVMTSIGMTRDPADDFDHPKLPEGHRVRPHVLYRIRR